MFRNTALVKWTTKNHYFNKNGYGTSFEIEALSFSDTGIRIQAHKYKYLTPFFKGRPDKKNSQKDYTLKIGPRFEHVSYDMSNIVLLDANVAEYIIDSASGFFMNSYPHADVNLVPFLRAKRAFFHGENNGLAMMPALVGDEFVRAFLQYGTSQKGGLFAKRLSMFAAEKSMELQR